MYVLAKEAKTHEFDGEEFLVSGTAFMLLGPGCEGDPDAYQEIIHSNLPNEPLCFETYEEADAYKEKYVRPANMDYQIRNINDINVATTDLFNQPSWECSAVWKFVLDNNENHNWVFIETEGGRPAAKTAALLGEDGKCRRVISNEGYLIRTSDLGWIAKTANTLGITLKIKPFDFRDYQSNPKKYGIFIKR